MQKAEGTSAAGGSGKASAVTVAGAVRENLEKAVEERRRQAVAVSEMVGALRARVGEISGELASSREENLSLIAEIARMKEDYDVLLSSHRRLYEGFTSLLKAVEDSVGAQLGIDQRIEAVLLSSDVGVELGVAADLTPTRMGNLINEGVRMPSLASPAARTNQR